ncbi:hypothetical protein CEXT_159521 [Caerostris extrusa]|uniref:Uncharacterized protein n=1 Tax=Caerostris extrusa TaxID=172846 RepID=A0AAV4T0S0_CAEEX|nr:hypothetical protein CEXT_159521 [Caerostris extrusa]
MKRKEEEKRGSPVRSGRSVQTARSGSAPGPRPTAAPTGGEVDDVRVQDAGKMNRGSIKGTGHNKHNFFQLCTKMKHVKFNKQYFNRPG